MDSDLEELFGTSEPPEALLAHACGPLSFRLGETAIRELAWRGVELVRAIDYPIRDENWATLPTRTISARFPQSDPVRWTREFETHDASFAGRFELSIEAGGRATFSLRIEVKRDARLCRAGFTLLHPISELAGCPMTLRRPSGETFNATFPADISPSQPVADFVAMSYAVRGASVAIEMMGAAFEMEDQRNWSDASYKSYVRTATFPDAFPVRSGDVIEQELRLAFSGEVANAASAAAAPALRLERSTTAEKVPELAVAMDSDWAERPLPWPLDGLCRLLRLDLRDKFALRRLESVRSRFDLELIVADERGELARQLEGAAAALARLGVAPDHVIALPAAYLKSYQPGGPWPKGAAPADAFRVARSAFPSARIGGGVLTNFTELNRCRPDASEIDYLTHGSSATVHAADDESVFQTLEALPDIFRSATRIAPGKSYRLGLVSIAMRGNPYGAALSPNLERRRRTMSAQDPRAQALFGAAWLVGVAAASERAGIELLTLASAGGPSAVLDDAGRLAPSFHVLAWLADMQGRSRLHPITGDKRIHAVAAERGTGAIVLLANGTPDSRTIACPLGGRGAVLDASRVKAAAGDPDWVERALRPVQAKIALPPYAVAFLDFAELAGGPR